MKNSVTSNLLKILIVEDSTSIAGRLKGLLTELTDHKCVGVAGTVAKALQLISLNMPDVVILDIHLQDEVPGITGIDLLRILQKDYPEVTVIMFTNYSEEQYRDRCEKLGAKYFFDKSVDFEKIPATLNEISSQRAKRN